MINCNINTLKTKFNKLIRTDTSTKLLSIGLAIIIWFVISISVYPTISKPLYNVPITINMEGTYAEANSLRVQLSDDETTASVYITGERRQIGNFDSDSISLNVDTTAVTTPGEYLLPLEVVDDSGKEFTVDKIVPSTVMVKIDKIITKEFTVTADIDSSISVAEGYMTKEPIFVSANTIAVTGPEEQVESITDVVVTVSSAEPLTLSSSYEFNSGDITLYNNNVKISNSDGSLSLSRTNFTVQIPVFVRQTLPLEVSVVNAPDGFDTEYFKSQLTMSAEALDIAAPTDKIKDISGINIGTINMREVDIGSTFTFNIDLPEGYENLSGLSTVTVKCPEEGLKKKLVAIREKNIQIVNQPSQYDFEFITSTLMPYFIGPEDEIDALTSTDITCKIDILNSDFNNQEGEYIVPTTFSISGTDKVWINAGSASLNVYVRAVAKDNSANANNDEQ
ncbi:MAG: hypothetical protein MR038_06815 [Oscillospiraceae bacterium]|nr:hypothetical protein [Oscillospiraceae bacterium]